ncbi:hypothetical protein QBC40DRAFT_256233 [Triangularia verruculosa]|uniref:Uncharacterized protein n=1 Tax=Triangularia verruculosa TaxID=2587418 RepID=A0AAN6XF11_9PEZI|nr:hypothetical protein QBC40DRAFT_256233 [Triangularia verruculosa]
MPPSKYRIIIKNQSGRHQDCSLFSGSPGPTNTSTTTFNTVLSSNASYPNSQVEFEIDARNYAVVGISRGTPGPGIKTHFNSRDVVVRSTRPNGTPIPGTTLSLIVSSNDPPSFTKGPPPETNDPGTFEIVTSPNFTQDEAVTGNWLIGIGFDAGDGVKAATAWTPVPNADYIIIPQRIFYLALGKYTVGDIVDLSRTKSIMFNLDSYLYKGVIAIISDKKGRLTIEK